MDIKPNFFIIGAAKTTTTSPSSMLSLYPQAGIVRGKEPHFLSFDQNFALVFREVCRFRTSTMPRDRILSASTAI